MKKDKNKGGRNDSNRNPEQQQSSSNRTGRQGKDSGGIFEGGDVPSGEKKPISHRTGDATNFGERSYRED